MAIVRGDKQRGHIPGVERVLPGHGTVIPSPSQSTRSADIARLKKLEKLPTKQLNMVMRLFRSDNKFSQMLTQLESQPEYHGGSGTLHIHATTITLDTPSPKAPLDVNITYVEVREDPDILAVNQANQPTTQVNIVV
nr:hypothetical protein [Tanacetum cinerariifolium]